ncbi:MAG: hypothetical protein NZ772_03740 [Cyanobacteria bacterium]|nr:hypothetical protein [Cyanobacteriota bacterium]MDW8200533.1 hypothetical protein [Cyanobacteriota bacterium SKYGB_h_bin112]
MQGNDMVLSAVVDDRWIPRIGDPTVMGWVTVVAYFAAAGLCLLCARYPDDRLAPRFYPYYRQFWHGVALVLVFLGVNKQLDLQSLLTVIGRNVVRSSGLNPYKRIIQGLFLLGLAVLSIVVASKGLQRFRWCYYAYRLTFLGLGFLILFVLARASSFHHFDWLINVQILGIRMNWILELGGISCVIVSAVRQLHRVRTHASNNSSIIR